jgi:serine O-acetyltransferase
MRPSHTGLGQHGEMPRRNPNPVLQGVRDRHPRFVEAIVADARMTAAQRMERSDFRSDLDTFVQILRLLWVSDAYAAQVCYRAKAALQAKDVPVLPRLLHRLAMTLAQVCIGDPVLIHPGFYLPHGQVVIDGVVEIHPGVTIRPWVTIGLKEGDIHGPTIKGGARIGTGAKIFGPVTVGAKAVIGANAVVVKDVPDGATVAGVPATER